MLSNCITGLKNIYLKKNIQENIQILWIHFALSWKLYYLEREIFFKDALVWNSDFGKTMYSLSLSRTTDRVDKVRKKIVAPSRPMMWREPSNLVDGFYSCCTHFKGFNVKKNSLWSWRLSRIGPLEKTVLRIWTVLWFSTKNSLFYHKSGELDCL